MNDTKWRAVHIVIVPVGFVTLAIFGVLLSGSVAVLAAGSAPMILGAMILASLFWERATA